MTGTVVRLVKDKKFGFIKGEDNKEYFFHQSGLKNTPFDLLYEGQDVTFEDVEGREAGKYRAEDIFV